MSKAGYPYDNAPMDCLITPYQEVFVYVKDKAAQGGVKHPLHTREKAFVEFCELVHVTQGMSKAGCPYDNAPWRDISTL